MSSAGQSYLAGRCGRAPSSRVTWRVWITAPDDRFAPSVSRWTAEGGQELYERIALSMRLLCILTAVRCCSSSKSVGDMMPYDRISDLPEPVKNVLPRKLLKSGGLPSTLQKKPEQ